MSDGLIYDHALFAQHPDEAIKCSDCAYHKKMSTQEPCRTCLEGFNEADYFVGKNNLRYYVIVKQVEREYWNDVFEESAHVQGSD